MTRAIIALFLLILAGPAWAQQLSPNLRQPPSGLYTVNGALKANGSGTVSQAACADLTNGTTVCSAAVGQLPGTTTNDDAAVGKVGEIFSSTVASGSAVSLVSATAKSVTSITLSAGDWDITGQINYIIAATTNVAFLRASSSITDNVLDATVGSLYNIVYPTAGFVSTTTSLDQSLSLTTFRRSVNASTQVFLVTTAQFSVSTVSAYGIIRARRVR